MNPAFEVPEKYKERLATLKKEQAELNAQYKEIEQKVQEKYDELEALYTEIEKENVGALSEEVRDRLIDVLITIGQNIVMKHDCDIRLIEKEIDDKTPYKIEMKVGVESYPYSLLTYDINIYTSNKEVVYIVKEMFTQTEDEDEIGEKSLTLEEAKALRHSRTTWCRAFDHSSYIKCKTAKELRKVY